VWIYDWSGSCEQLEQFVDRTGGIGSVSLECKHRMSPEWVVLESVVWMNRGKLRARIEG